MFLIKAVFFIKQHVHGQEIPRTCQPLPDEMVFKFLPFSKAAAFRNERRQWKPIEG